MVQVLLLLLVLVVSLALESKEFAEGWDLEVEVEQVVELVAITLLDARSYLEQLEDVLGILLPIHCLHQVGVLDERLLE